MIVDLLTATYNPDGAYDNAAYNAEPTPAWVNPNPEWDPNRAWDDTVRLCLFNFCNYIFGI